MPLNPMIKASVIKNILKNCLDFIEIHKMTEILQYYSLNIRIAYFKTNNLLLTFKHKIFKKYNKIQTYNVYSQSKLKLEELVSK